MAQRDNLWGNIEDMMTSPLWLGGAALLTGEGMTGAMRGMQAGNQYREQRRERGLQDEQVRNWQSLFSNPESLKGVSPALVNLARAAGPQKGYGILAQELGRDPLDRQYKQAQIDALRRKGSGDEDYSARAAAAVKFGMQPGTPQFQSYVLTGRMPREDQQPYTVTDKKAILEADEMVSANKAVLSALDEADKLNPKANSGWFAQTRAELGNNLPDWAVPDFVSSPEGSLATTNLDNAVVGQALQQLKTIFGGNPTEGERRILLDLQGSSNLPVAARKEIFDRARRAATARLQFNQERADALRGQQYYKPQGAPGTVPDFAAGLKQGGPQPQATKTINGKTYVQIDGQWFER